MFGIDFNSFKNSALAGIDGMWDQFYNAVEIYLPKLIGALLIVGLGVIVSILSYKLIIYIFNKFKIIELIDRLFISMRMEEIEAEKKARKTKPKPTTTTQTKTTTKTKPAPVVNEPVKIEKISDQIKIDVICAKSLAYYLFLIFFRYAIVFIGIKEVEDFLAELIAYLPNLFIAIVIGFFGIRFANFVYDIVFHALDLTKQKTAKIVASGARIIVLFFTLMVVLSKIGIATMITNTILIGFISMLALAGGLAFGLGGKDVAQDILESFRK